jgi:hypothetical protein
MFSWLRPKRKSIPTRPFHGWVKCHRPEHRNALGDLVLSKTFPFFEGSDGKEDINPFDQAIADVAPATGYEVLRCPENARMRRRFAGDIRSIHTLERGRYYTVCEDAMGSDSNTLANEMNAYCDPSRAGFGLAVDLAHPNSFTEQPTKALVIHLSNVPGAASAALMEAQRSEALPADKSSASVMIPYNVSEFQVDNVFDLRFPDARQWLFDTFARGDGDWIEFKGTPLPKKIGFFGLLPTLMTRANGGNDITDTIGAYLRSHGIEALIFPSARSNVFSVFENGTLKGAGGWTLVDYRNTSEEIMKRKTIWMTDWEQFVDAQTRVEMAPPESSYSGSFIVRGNEEHHHLIRHLFLCFRVWDASGEDTPVVGYRWHATRSFRRNDKRFVSVVCQNCAHEIPMVPALFDIPNACPVCSSDTVVIP